MVLGFDRTIVASLTFLVIGFLAAIFVALIPVEWLLSISFPIEWMLGFLNEISPEYIKLAIPEYDAREFYENYTRVFKAVEDWFWGWLVWLNYLYFFLF
jgi:hypothetical protein